MNPQVEAAAERLINLLYPRRCPLCGGVVYGTPWNGAVCPDCAREADRLCHQPPRLPATEHEFYAVNTAAGAFYYADGVRHGILLCKEFGKPWFAREFADLIAVLVYGAEPAPAPGRMPVYQNLTGIPLYHAIVPVVPREKRHPADNLPLLLARRLGRILNLTVLCPLVTTRSIRPQKTLDLAQRQKNTNGAYACRPGTDLTGKRILLVDDIITSGSTVSACALALLAAGAVAVDAVCIAAAEDLPREKQKPKPAKRKFKENSHQ